MYWIHKSDPTAPNPWGHAAAIRANATAEIPASLLVSMAYAESRFRPNALSVLLCPTESSPREECKRIHVLIKSDKRNPLWHKKSYFCGPMQVTPKSWEHCIRMTKDLNEAYRVGVKILGNWREAARKHKACQAKEGRAFEACALRGYGGGYKLLPKTKHPYAWKVLNRADKLWQ